MLVFKLLHYITVCWYIIVSCILIGDVLRSSCFNPVSSVGQEYGLCSVFIGID